MTILDDPEMMFNCLMPHFNRESLSACFNELYGRKSVGINGQTKAEYGKSLEQNLEVLISRMKTMSCRPAPVREVLLPRF